MFTSIFENIRMLNNEYILKFNAKFVIYQTNILLLSRNILEAKMVRIILIYFLERFTIKVAAIGKP